MNEDTATENLMSDEGAEASKGKGKRARATDFDTKVKMQFSVASDHWINRFSDQCKTRGIKNIEISDIVLSALQETSDDWWEKKLDELTPLEYRINAALSDPNMREKLQELLASQVAKMPN